MFLNRNTHLKGEMLYYYILYFIILIGGDTDLRKHFI